jgi:2-hydroxy-3-oxopropionate reductase
MTTPVGFIGLGNIGKPMAINLTRARFDLTVYDLRAEPMGELTAMGAKAARSADEVGAPGEIIEVVVVDDAQVEAALLGWNTRTGRNCEYSLYFRCLTGKSMTESGLL